MAWIELHQAVRDHRKIVELADALEMPEPHVVGHLAFLWLWALDNAPEGVLPESNRVIAKAAQWAGDPDTFVAALTRCGLLDNNSVDREIHGWSEYAGKLIDRRKANALRMKNQRAQHVQRTCDERASKVQSYSTVPNPTVPSKQLTNSRERGKTAAAPPRARGTRIDADWHPSDIDIAFARSEGMSERDIQREAQKFRDHWCSTPGAKGTKLDWPATWRNWIRREMSDPRRLRVVNGTNGHEPKRLTPEEVASGLYDTY